MRSLRFTPLPLILSLIVLAACGSPAATPAAPATAPAAAAPAAPTIASTAAAVQTAAPTTEPTLTAPVAATSTAEAPATAAATAAPTAAAAGQATATATAATVAPSPSPSSAVQPAAEKQGPASAAQAAPPAGVSLRLIAEGLTSPVTLVPAPDNSGRLFVVDQIGQIRIIGADGQLQPAPFLDVRDRIVQLHGNYDERGLLGLAFHPDFSHNQRFFVYYVAPLRQGGPQGWDNTVRLSEFKVAANNPNQADPNSEKVLLEIDHPEANHEGGTIAFGPDGYLYLSIGDGGAGNDVGLGHTPGIGNAQDLSKPLGKILRIDVNNPANGKYAIPADNPFAKGPVPEIFAYGLRNPYRMSFDRGGNHALYAADAGQDLFEEVDVITKGGNYGWHIKEGTHCFDPANATNPPATCPNTGANGEPLINPIIEYSHDQVGIVDVGGYVYRGTALPGLVGRYVFGDWGTGYNPPDGTLLVAGPPANGQGLWQWQKLQINGSPNGKLNHFVLGFGQDLAGEMYVLTSDQAGPAGNTGRVFKITP
jgi:glucose/arabinose dehydrogenase